MTAANCSVGGGDGAETGNFNSGRVASEVSGKWRPAAAVPA